MNKKLKITIKIIELVSKKVREHFNNLKSEYENIVYNIDKTYWNTIDVKPTDNKTIIFYVENDKFENHYHILLDKMIDKE